MIRFFLNKKISINWIMKEIININSAIFFEKTFTLFKFKDSCWLNNLENLGKQIIL